jgi:hypothetical protein
VRVRRTSMQVEAEAGAAATASASAHWTRADANSTALLVQLLLALDRKDLAQTTYQAAKRIGNDSTLIQAMEAWIGLKTVSRPRALCLHLHLHVGCIHTVCHGPSVVTVRCDQRRRDFGCRLCTGHSSSTSSFFTSPTSPPRQSSPCDRKPCLPTHLFISPSHPITHSATHHHHYLPPI